MSPPQEALQDTGERLLMDRPPTSREDHLNRLVHVATYDFAHAHVAGARVLDLGCGTGYGAARVAQVAAHVVGADVCAEALAHATGHNAAPNLTYSLLPRDGALPFEAGAFDVVLSFQVIEHLANPHAHLREVSRVLAPGGTLLLATPNRHARLLPFQRPWNRWHPTEYDHQSLQTLLRVHFPDVEVLDLSGDAAVVQPLLRRYRWLAWATLPVTLPGLPEALRVGGLGLLRRLQSLRRPVRDGAGFVAAAGDIRIAPGLTPSLHLVAVARLPAGS
ncbi:MAG: class I SAM-dependent methyltransferase [Candidatus Sericytochromatia bacterium]|nr:class I SAM-dependent methyltransferase [Candidatus Sericytochromatia bacterium]